MCRARIRLILTRERVAVRDLTTFFWTWIAVLFMAECVIVLTVLNVGMRSVPIGIFVLKSVHSLRVFQIGYRLMKVTRPGGYSGWRGIVGGRRTLGVSYRGVEGILRAS